MTTVENNQSQSEASALAGNDHPGVSAIIFEDVKHQQRAIARIRHQFKMAHVPVEFVVISESGIKLTPLSDHQQRKVAKNLDAAIRCAKFDQIAIFDANFQFSIADWNAVLSNSEADAFQSWSYRSTKAPRSRRILVGLYLVIVRWLLRVRKNRLTPGFISFRKTSLREIDLAQLDHATPDAGTQLLAMAKCQGKSVVEHSRSDRQPGLTWEKQNSQEPHFPKSKSVKRSIARNLQFWFCKLAFPQRDPVGNRTSGRWEHILGSVCLLLLASMVLFFNSSFPLFEPDETRNAQLALNILESGDWISLELNDQHYWDKPPLLAWTTALSYRVFGVSEFATRLPSMVSSLLLIIVIMMAGSSLYGFRAAFFGSVALLLAWGFSFQARYVTMDAMLSLFTTTTILASALGIGANSKKLRSRIWLLIAGVAMGLGILTKGPICLVLTLPTLLGWMFLSRMNSKRQIRGLLKYVLAPAAAIALPWFVAMSIRTPEFPWHFLWKHHVVRFTDAFNHEEPFWFYAPVLWLFMFPASILLPCAIRFVYSKREDLRSKRAYQHGLLAIATIWTIGFFSLSDCKLPAYILPAFPMIALLIGSAVDIEFSRDLHWRTRFDKLPKRIGIGVSLITLFGILFGRIFSESHFIISWHTLTAIGLLGIALPLTLMKGKPGKRLPWLGACIVAIVFVSQGVNFVVPGIAQDRSILHCLSRMNRETTPDQIVYFGRDSHASSMYLDEGSVSWIAEDNFGKLKDKLVNHRSITLVTSDAHVDRIQSLIPGIDIQPQQPRHTFRAQLSNRRISALDSTTQR